MDTRYEFGERFREIRVASWDDFDLASFEKADSPQKKYHYVAEYLAKSCHKTFDELTAAFMPAAQINEISKLHEEKNKTFKRYRKESESLNECREKLDSLCVQIFRKKSLL